MLQPTSWKLAAWAGWICLPVQCWSMVRLAGAADLQHLAVARSALLSRPAVETLFDQCSWLLSTPRLAEPCQVTALLGNKLKTCSVNAAWAGWTVQCWGMVRLAGAADLQHLAVARSVLQPRPAVGTLCRLV